MSSLNEWPEIDEQDIRRLATEPSFERGLEYHINGAIADMVQQENELHACCQGSGHNVYRVSVTWDARGVRDYACTCPYMGGGACKHVVALLLDWIHAPETARLLPPVQEMLAEHSREELIALIREMLRQQPSLRRLLAQPLAAFSEPAGVEAVRERIHGLFHPERGWGFESMSTPVTQAAAAAAELSRTAETVERLLQAEDWPAAGALCQTALQETAAGYAYLSDDDHEIAYQATQFAEGLDLCLAAPGIDAATRLRWLDALLDIWLADVEIGGIDLGCPAPDVLLQRAMAGEWEHIAARIRERLAATRPQPYSDWRQSALVDVLTRGEVRHGGEAGATIMELGTPRQRALFLIGQGQIEQAVQVAEQHFGRLPGTALELADALAAAGAIEAARGYLAGSLQDRPDPRHLSWLAEHEVEPAAALAWYGRLFEATQSLDAYRLARDKAEAMGCWPQARQELIAQAAARQWIDLLIEIAVDEKDIQEALALLPMMQFRRSHYALQVAQLAEPDEPQIALDLYASVVEDTIDNRSRPNYQTAAALLHRMRGLYTRLQAPLEWIEYLGDLRKRYRRLRALQDELNRAGL